MMEIQGSTRRRCCTSSSPSSQTMMFICCGILLSVASGGRAQNTTSESDVAFDPTYLKQMVEGTHHVVTWYSNLSSIASVKTSVQDQMVIGIASVSPVMETEDGINGSTEDGINGSSFYGQFNVTAIFIGYSDIYVEFYDERGVILAQKTVPTSVVLSYQNINDIFTLAIGILVALAYINIGATMKLDVVAKICKKPIGPVVGVFCQYVLMPLIAFGLGKVVFPGNPMAQVGMFLSGTSPGGGLSNMWTHLLGGSIDLSVMMTFISNIIAFGTIPLWVYTMGPMILGDADFVIPYKDIFVVVVSLTVPCIVGMLIQRFLPKVAKYLAKLLTPVSVFNIVFIFTFGIYANRYIFSYFTVQTILVGFLSPFLGYLSGMILAKMCCLPNKDIIAISIETGVQNNTVAFIILKLTFDKPAGDITAIFPCAAVLMTPLPLLLAILIKRIYEWKNPSKSQDEKTKKTDEIGDDTKGKDNPVMQDEDAAGEDTKPPASPAGVDNPAINLKDETV